MIDSTFKVFVMPGSFFFFFFGKGLEVKAVRKNSTKLHDNKNSELLLNIISFLDHQATILMNSIFWHVFHASSQPNNLHFKMTIQKR